MPANMEVNISPCLFSCLLLLCVAVNCVKLAPLEFLSSGKIADEIHQNSAPSSAPNKEELASSNDNPALTSTEVVASEKQPRIPEKIPRPDISSSPEQLLDEFMNYGKENITASESSYKLGYSVDDGRFKRFRYEEKTPEGTIVGGFGYHWGDGEVRGVQYTAEAGVHPKLLYEALVKFLSL